MNTVDNSYFSPDRPEIILSSDHQAIISALKAEATADDVLMTSMVKPPWENDLLWLAPEFPGKFYCGHYFLTVDYGRKRQEVIDFYDAPPERQASFLTDNHIRFIFVAADENPLRFERVPGLKPIRSSSVGTLSEFTPARAMTQPDVRASRIANNWLRPHTLWVKPSEVVRGILRAANDT